MDLKYSTCEAAHSIELAMDQERSEYQWRIMDQKRSGDVPGEKAPSTYGVSRPRADTSSYRKRDE
jgi:hypothetical protein